jgi:hypothetical protein
MRMGDGKLFQRPQVRGVMAYVKAPNGIPLIFNLKEGSIHYHKWITPHTRVVDGESDEQSLRRILSSQVGINSLTELREVGTAFYDNSERTFNGKKVEYDYWAKIYIARTKERPLQYTPAPEKYQITNWNREDIYTLAGALHEGDLHLLDFILPEFKRSPAERREPFLVDFGFEGEELTSFKKRR